MTFNPYTSPQSDLGDVMAQGAREYPGLNRLMFFLTGLGAVVILFLIAWFSKSGPEGPLVGLAVAFVGVVISVQRVRNIGWSGWWGLLQLVPVASFVQTIFLISAPAGYADTKRFDTAGKILLGISIAIAILSGLAVFSFVAFFPSD